MADSSPEDNAQNNVTIKALRKNTLLVISQLLNPIKVIPTAGGLPRDWQGLAELVQIGGEHIPYLQNNLDPTCEVLNLWNKHNQEAATIENLLNHFEILDRFDIIEDITLLIQEDIKCYKKNGSQSEVKELDLYADKYILTTDDVVRIKQGLTLQNYDAFVLFADEDIDFATELIDTMEKQYNMKFCVKSRDLVGGCFEHEVIIKLISERCNRLIVIFSKAFANSPANIFFTRFAQAIAIEQKERKIIPCLLEPCQLPLELKYHFILDYKRSGKLYNFWEKLYHSVQTPTTTCDKMYSNGVSNQLSPQALKPALHCENGNQGLKKEGVKFRSMVDVNKIDTEVFPDAHMNTSSSLNAISGEVKKAKAKNGWFKFLNHRSEKQTNGATMEKRKKRLWPIRRKTTAVDN